VEEWFKKVEYGMEQGFKPMDRLGHGGGWN